METHSEGTPSQAALKYSAATFIQKLRVEISSDPSSPNLMSETEYHRQYVLTRERAGPTDRCGKSTYIGVVGNKDASEAEAQYGCAIWHNFIANLTMQYSKHLGVDVMKV